MPRTPKEECDPEELEEGVLAEDQERRQYYYDDAHGYETYDPEEEGDEDEETENEKN